MTDKSYTAHRKLGIIKEFHQAPPEKREDLMREHLLSFAELKEWCDRFEKSGVDGLREKAIKGRRLR